MNIDYLIQLLTNKLSGLALAKDQAFSSGDLERINAVDAEILDVKNTISKLKLVSNIEQAAALTSFSEADIVKNGIESTFTPTIINDSTEVLLKYNIAPYATDPYHETKIQSILENMGLMSSPDDIENYLRKKVPDSPLNGIMIYDSSLKFSVDIRLMMAIMELDSRFGTQGVGARTYNPGNVGNTGFEERSYISWQDGVDAVASWLNNHRIVNTVEEVTVNSNPVVEVANIQYTTSPVSTVNNDIATPVATTTVNITPDTASGVTSYATSSVAVSESSTTTDAVVNVDTSTSTSTPTESTDSN